MTNTLITFRINNYKALGILDKNYARKITEIEAPITKSIFGLCSGQILAFK
jgi:hypothetical protein